MRPLRFAGFELDPTTDELRHNGRRVSLRPQPVQLLALLASRPGELVTRDQVRRHLWGDDTHVDFDQGIGYAVHEVRKALGDSAQTPRFVETLPGKGFRFLADVRAGGPETASTPRFGSEGGSEKTPVRRLPHSPRRWLPSRRWLSGALAGLGVLALLALGASLGGRQGSEVGLQASPERPASTKIRLAVLPFEDLTGESGPYVANLTDELIRQLGQRYGNRLDVIALRSRGSVRAGVRTGSGGDGSWEALAAEVGADQVLDGRVLATDERVHVQVSLLTPGEPEPDWKTEAEVFSRDLPDLVAAQVRLSYEIAHTLAPEIVPSEQQRRESSWPRSDRAQRDYLEAILLLRTKGRSVYPQAMELLEGILEEQPEAAVVRLEVTRLLGRQGRFREARYHLERAVRDDPNLAEAHNLLGEVRLIYDRDLAGARESIQTALRLNPALGRAHESLGFVLLAQGRREEAVGSIRKALSLAPHDPIVTASSGWALYLARRFDEAAEVCRRATLQQAELFPAYVCRILAHVALGDETGALEVAAEERAIFRQPPPETLETYWRWRLDLIRGWPPVNAPPTSFAILHMGLGDGERALDELERSFELEEGWDRLFLADYPWFDPLRGDPRYERLVAKLAEGAREEQRYEPDLDQGPRPEPGA